jgi:hypothetical protein
MIGEERKKLPVKIDENTEEGAEVVSEVVYKDEVSLEQLSNALEQRVKLTPSLNRILVTSSNEVKSRNTFKLVIPISRRVSKLPRSFSTKTKFAKSR